MGRKCKTDAEKKQARKEALEKMAHSSLVNKVLMLESEVDSLRTRQNQLEYAKHEIEESLRGKESEIYKLEQRLRFHGIKPERLMIEYYKEQVNQPDEYGYSGLDETEVESVGVVSESVLALEWYVRSGNHEDYEPTGIHIEGVDADFERFDYSEVIAYTTPDGRRYVFEEGDE